MTDRGGRGKQFPLIFVVISVTIAILICILYSIGQLNIHVAIPRRQENANLKPYVDVSHFIQQNIRTTPSSVANPHLSSDSHSDSNTANKSVNVYTQIDNKLESLINNYIDTYISNSEGLDPNAAMYESFRSKEDRMIAYRKFFSENESGELIFIHFRKAGGTTFRTYLTYIKDDFGPDSKYNNTITTHETFTYIHRNFKQFDYYFLNYFLFNDKHKHSLFATMLRDPIDRIISQYNFDWRFGCEKCNWNVYKNNKRDGVVREFDSGDNNDNDTFIMQQRKYNEKYRQWRYSFEHVYNNVMYNKKGFNGLYARACFDNHYIWMFTCRSPNDNVTNITQLRLNKNDEIAMEKLILSMKILNSFDIVMITEWFKDLRNIHYLNQFFYNRSYDYLPMQKAIREPILPNRGSIELINDTVLNQVKLLNVYDTILYQFGQRVSYQRMKQFNVWNDSYLLPRIKTEYLLYNKSDNHPIKKNRFVEYAKRGH